MELAFLTKAIRRYWWVIVIGAVLGALPGLLLSGGGGDDYESRAVVLVAPPSQSAITVSFSGDPDRYVAGQLSVLRSEGMAQRAADLLDDGSRAGDVAGTVRFDQEPLTDVVSVVSTTNDPERSQAVANAYVEAYIAQLNAQLAGSQAPELDRLDAEIEEVLAQIDEIDAQLGAVMGPLLGRDPIPTPEQVAPNLVSEKTLLLAEYTELQTSRAELRRGLRVATEVVQDATLPTEAVESPYRTLVLAGMLVGAFAGLVAAAVIARLSPTVLGDEQAEEILGHAVVGSIPMLPDVTGHRPAILEEPPPRAAWFVESLCVRVEAAAEGRGALAVVVTGTQSRAGATTLAAALARGFSGPRSRVLLVDADPRQPEISALFVRQPRPALVPVGGGIPDPPQPGDDLPTATGVPNLHVTSLGLLAELSTSGDGDRSARRPDLARLLATAWMHADVLVFDGGPLMSAVSTVQLTRLCDVVVLAMPRRQQVRGLETVAGELRGHQHVLPVWTPAGARRRQERSSEPAHAADSTIT